MCRGVGGSEKANKKATILILRWGRTFLAVLAKNYNSFSTGNVSRVSFISVQVNVYLDRNRLISPFAIESSISTIQQIDARISNLALQYGFSPSDNLLGQLQAFSSTIFSLRLTFTLVLTLFAILTPARQAAAMDPAQALKGYVYLEETRPIRKRGAILALTLGSYQLITIAIGINYMNIGRYVYNANFLLVLFLIIAAVLGFALSFIGPFLFLYGAAQLSTGLAERFHRKFSTISRWMIGDVAALASNNVFRNPRRVAALVFIVALIFGYSGWVIGGLASEQDYND